MTAAQSISSVGLRQTPVSIASVGYLEGLQPHHSAVVRLMMMGLWDEQKRIVEGEDREQQDKDVIKKKDGSPKVKRRTHKKKPIKKTRRAEPEREYQSDWAFYFRPPKEPELDILGIALANQEMLQDLVANTLFPVVRVVKLQEPAVVVDNDYDYRRRLLLLAA